MPCLGSDNPGVLWGNRRLSVDGERTEKTQSSSIFSHDNRELHRQDEWLSYGQKHNPGNASPLSFTLAFCLFARWKREKPKQNSGELLLSKNVADYRTISEKEGFCWDRLLFLRVVDVSVKLMSFAAVSIRSGEMTIRGSSRAGFLPPRVYIRLFVCFFWKDREDT